MSRNIRGCKWQSKCWSTHNIRKNVFNSFITGYETGIYFYEPKRKVDNRIWALKYAKMQCIAKRTLIAKKDILRHFLQKLLFQLVEMCLVASMWLKKLRTKLRKVRPKTDLQHAYLLYDNAVAHKSSTVAQLKSEKVNVLSHPLYSPDLALCDIFLFSKLKINK